MCAIVAKVAGCSDRQGTGYMHSSWWMQGDTNVKGCGFIDRLDMPVTSVVKNGPRLLVLGSMNLYWCSAIAILF
jgi:hypothetical protein